MRRTNLTPLPMEPALELNVYEQNIIASIIRKSIERLTVPDLTQEAKDSQKDQKKNNFCNL